MLRLKITSTVLWNSTTLIAFILNSFSTQLSTDTWKSYLGSGVIYICFVECLKGISSASFHRFKSAKNAEENTLEFQKTKCLRFLKLLRSFLRIKWMIIVKCATFTPSKSTQKLKANVFKLCHLTLENIFCSKTEPCKKKLMRFFRPALYLLQSSRMIFWLLV